ncbi:MAG: EAL domain-containing protein [Chromatiales bacterium]|nr:EAL domain-containing protein [Chromatiales bacterium]
MSHQQNSGVDILAGQAKVLFGSAYSAGVANMGTALVFYLLIMQSNIGGYASIWLIVMLAISVARVGVGIQGKKNRLKERTEPLLRRYFVIILLLGFGWGFVPIMQYQVGIPEIRDFSFLIYLGLIAATISTLSAWIPAFVAFVLPQFTILIGVLMLEQNTFSYFAAVAMAIFTLLMLVSVKHINRRLIETLALKSANLRLIEDLNGEIVRRSEVQKELERHQAELEGAVDERTRELVDINESLQKAADERQQAEENLRYAEQYDQLTGLPNRILLLDRIKHATSTSAREQKMVAVLFVGVDRFKTINESLGHTVGDALLKQAASRLELLLREGDTVARNGGDEFAIILERIESPNVAEVVARKMTKSLSESFDIAGHTIHIGASIGIAISPSDGDGPQQLLESADTAMHRAKQAGGNSYQFYAEGMSQEVRERLDMENKLRFAADLGELFMVYQPQVDSATGKTVGFEALIRWINPELGFVGPDQFIPLLEENGMIHSVGEWIIKDVARFIQSGESQGCRVSINLSARQCSQVGLGDFIQDVVDAFELDPSLIEFELTESMLIDDFDRSTVLINKLKKMGCTIALDDFGTGYTSMSYLTRLNIDVIKIDRSFVTGIDSDENLRKIVYAIIGMSQSLEIENVIEGVETPEELATVQSLGGNIIQGYLYSKPLKRGEELESWFNR